MMMKIRMAHSLVLPLLMAAAAAGAQVPTARPTPAPAGAVPNDGYRLAPDDEVEVTIFGQGPGQVVKTAAERRLFRQARRQC
jgi:polysaccharide export outer membrane protein